MKILNKKSCVFLISILILSFTNKAFACACGRAILDVSTNALIPNGKGGLAFLEYDYINQDRNWNKEKSAPAANNNDKKVLTQMLVAGIQYNFNQDWGLMLRVPYVFRRAKIEHHHIMSSRLLDNSENSVGDIRLTANYSSFSSSR
jgi:hypothetical protein